MKKNERLQALHILVRLLEDKINLSNSISSGSELSSLGREICYGVCRHYFRLQQLADSLLEKRPKSLDVWVALLMGLYQLAYLK